MKVYFTQSYRCVSDTYVWGILQEDGTFEFLGSEFDGDCSDPSYVDPEGEIYIEDFLRRDGYVDLQRIQELSLETYGVGQTIPAQEPYQMESY